MPIYWFQDKAVTGNADIEIEFNIRNELIYFLGIYCKEDGIDVRRIPNMFAERETTGELNIESDLELYIYQFWDEEYHIQLTEMSTAENQVTVIVLTIDEGTAKKLREWGIPIGDFRENELKRLGLTPVHPHVDPRFV